MTKSFLPPLVACLLLSIGVFSQKKPEFGLNVGGSYTTLWGNDFAGNVDYNIGYLAGLHIEYEFTPGLIMAMDLNYERRSIDTPLLFFDVAGPPVVVGQNKDTYDYLNIPIMLKVPFGAKDLWFFNFGPFANILLNDNVEIETFGNSYKKLDFGLLSGFGKSFILDHKNQLAIELRADLGVLNISNLTSDTLGLETLRTSTLKLMLTWAFTNY